MTEAEATFIDRLWSTGAMNENNWKQYLEKVKLEANRDTAVFDAYDNSFKARLRRSREKLRRQLLAGPKAE